MKKQCKQITKKGKRCKKEALWYGFCTYHYMLDDIAKETTQKAKNNTLQRRLEKLSHYHCSRIKQLESKINKLRDEKCKEEQ